MVGPRSPSRRTLAGATRSAWISLAVLTLVIVGGTAGYVVIEGWSVLDSVWMVVITLTTIGYGEAHPLSPAGRLFSLGLILGGVGVGTFALSRLAGTVLDGELVRALRSRRKERKMKALKDHFVVVGYGRLGKVVVEDLLRTGVGVCVVERDPALVAELAEDGSVPVVQGDAATDDVLRLAGVERARGLAIALPSAAEAVYVSMAAAQINPTLNIVTRVDEQEATHRARRVGARQVVNPYRMAGWRIAHGLLRPHAANFLDLATFSVHEEFSVDEVTLAPGSPFAGRSLREVKVGSEHGILVVAIQKPSGALLATPGAAVVLEPGDTVIVIGEPDRLISFATAAAPPGESGSRPA